MTEPVVISEPGRVWRLTLNRPDARNAVSSAMIGALVAELDRAAGDPECRVVMVRGAGKDFCAGADVAELVEMRDEAGALEYGRAFEGALEAIECHPRPLVAVVQGAALGAGCQIALACDLGVAEEEARFGIPSAGLGIVITLENVERLVVAIGPKRAGEMLLSGRVVTGYEAVEWGLVSVVAATGEVDATATELAGRVADLAPLSVAASKRGIRSVLAGVSQEQRAEFEALAAQALASDDLVEGLTAFRERRRAVFRGR